MLIGERLPMTEPDGIRAAKSLVMVIEFVLQNAFELEGPVAVPAGKTMTYLMHRHSFRSLWRTILPVDFLSPSPSIPEGKIDARSNPNPRRCRGWY